MNKLIRIMNGQFGKKVLNEPYRGIWKKTILSLVVFTGVIVFLGMIQFMGWLTEMFNYVIWG